MQRAYSLIELVVVLGIITMLALLGLPNILNQSSRYDLSSGTEKIRQMLADAQVRSLAPTKNDSQGTQMYQVDFSNFMYDSGSGNVTTDTNYTASNGYGTRNVTESRGLAECSNGQTIPGSALTTVDSLQLPKNVYIADFYPNEMTQTSLSSSVRFYVGQVGFRCGSTDKVDINSADYYSDSRWQSHIQGSSDPTAITYAKYMVITVASLKTSQQLYIIIDRLSSQISVTDKNPQAYISPIADKLPPQWRDPADGMSPIYATVTCMPDNSGANVSLSFMRSDDWVGIPDPNNLTNYPANWTYDPRNYKDKTKLVFYDIFFNSDSANNFPDSSNKIITLKYFYPLLPDKDYVTYNFTTNLISISNQPGTFHIIVKTFDENGNYNLNSPAVGAVNPTGIPNGNNLPVGGSTPASSSSSSSYNIFQKAWRFARIHVVDTIAERLAGLAFGKSSPALPVVARPGTDTGEFTNGSGYTCGNTNPPGDPGNSATDGTEAWKGQPLEAAPQPYK